MIAQRTFDSYGEYVHQQGRKAIRRREFLLRHTGKNVVRFTRIFGMAKPHLNPGAILCLGARTGAESLGAAAAGFYGSVGIDLHPVGPTVLTGDWHALTFPDGRFANVYCNSLDHCLSLDRMSAEVRRVLQPGGRFYVMATNRAGSAEEWQARESNEALYWSSSDDLRDAICARGFDPIMAWRTGKWGHYILGVRP